MEIDPRSAAAVTGEGRLIRRAGSAASAAWNDSACGFLMAGAEIWRATAVEGFIGARCRRVLIPDKALVSARLSLQLSPTFFKVAI